MIVDALGNPLTFTLTAAHVADVSAAKPLIEQTKGRGGGALACICPL